MITIGFNFTKTENIKAITNFISILNFLDFSFLIYHIVRKLSDILKEYK